MMKYQIVHLLTLCMFLLPVMLRGQNKNYQLDNDNKVVDADAFGDNVKLVVSFSSQDQASIEKESALGAAVTVASAVLPKALNLIFNSKKRRIKRRLKEYVAEHTATTTIVYPDNKSVIDEIVLTRSIILKNTEIPVTALQLTLKRLPETENIFQVVSVSLPFSKAKIRNDAPFLKIGLNMELLAYNADSSKMVTAKSTELILPLIKVGTSTKDLSAEEIYTSRFYNISRPSELKITVNVSNPSKVKYEDIEEELEEKSSDVKETVEALTVAALAEILKRLEKEDEDDGDNNDDSGIENEGGI